MLFCLPGLCFLYYFSLQLVFYCSLVLYCLSRLCFVTFLSLIGILWLTGLPIDIQYCIYSAIKFAKTNVIQFNNKKKDNRNSIDASIVAPVRGMVRLI